ncbi:nitrous oxide reductase accessory protein NosL [Flagellimonas sp. CMM7]|uniref:nitrous oxide reductase accessory protein NosL n=1 Tax=Flagellimonas sp. CMM7 TaxID=2654676 RepID=UPI0013D48352|nr:nitrous oxide reductase accessory protein NosL [Flagellimonas sp. CMM7]UII80418.1 nitrous oxide reductase accessory protein NosL [Flagellimonas sp. CMM7]
MKQYFIVFGFTLMLLASSCTIGPKPINYGSDGCHFCKMTIVDKQHAAEFVTKKGKVFKFDAAECMMNHLSEIDETTVSLFLVNDYNTPGELIDATKATYLISKNIPSPMGEYLTAFEIKEIAEKAQADNEGELFTWEELGNRFKIKTGK